MQALYAGLAAWGIELAVAGLAFYLLYREEQKVYSRRKWTTKTKKDIRNKKQETKKEEQEQREEVLL